MDVLIAILMISAIVIIEIGFDAILLLAILIVKPIFIVRIACPLSLDLHQNQFRAFRSQRCRKARNWFHD
ncbi:MAG: hypothetical protein DCF20_00910 [Pseudanabaena sp.]|nr:MAG: hypothetical protein DCF20_00910 [Pseudanabaena sp.]